MTLVEWIAKEGKGAITRLARDTGLNYKTVFYLCHGAPVKTWATAKKIHSATQGEVSITELCEPPPNVRAMASGVSPGGAGQA